MPEQNKPQTCNQLGCTRESRVQITIVFAGYREVPASLCHEHYSEYQRYVTDLERYNFDIGIDTGESKR